MRKIRSFSFMTVNGFFKGPDGDTSWHIHGEEGNRYSEEKLKNENILLFGRVTYEMMSAFWPGEAAAAMFPAVAKMMNESEKIVLSNTLKSAGWKNTTVISGDGIQRVKELKGEEGKDITVLGSGSVVAQFTNSGLIDEYEFLIDPVAIGKGTPLMAGIENNLKLKLKGTRIFHMSGAVVLTYSKT